MRAAASWWGLGVWLATLAFCTAAAAATRVYGIEHQVEGKVERILVFADGPLKARFEPGGKRRGELVIEDATLDPSAPQRLELPPGGPYFQVTASAEAGDAPRVRIQVLHAEDLTPKLVERDSQIALELVRGAVPAAAAPAPGGLILDVKDFPLREVVVRIARHTATPVLFDETLQGNVTIMAKEPFTSAEALMLLDTLLLMKGYVALPSPGGVRKIVRLEGAPWPYVLDLARAAGDEPVTTLIHLHSINAETVLLALRPMLGSTTLGFAHAPSNALILGGSAALIKRIIDVTRALDASGAERIFLHRLRFAGAEDTARQLETAFGEAGLVAVHPDARTNTLALRARADSVGALRDFIARVDRPAPARGTLHVFPVQHADADVLAQILNELQLGGGAPARTTPPGGRRGRAVAVDPVAGGAALAGREFAVVVDPPTHSLIVQADPDTAALVGGVVAELDRVPRQVDVEVTLMEVTTGHGIELAFDYFLPLVEPSDPDDLIAFVAGLPSGASSLFDGTPVEQTISPLVGLPPVDKSLLARFAREPLFLPLVINGQTVPVAIPRETGALSANERNIQTDLVLSPRLKLIAGEEHEIFVGESVPILTEQANNVNPLQVRQNIERQDVGVVLRVKPTLGEAGGVVLELTLEVSALAPSQAGSTAEVGPTIRERTLTSKIRLEPDRVAVIGWQSGPQSATSVTGVPFLMDIPWLGWLFRSSVEATVMNNVLITVAAWRHDPEVEALAEAMRSALAPGEKLAAPVTVTP